jgi:hypothetical protein
MLSISDPSAFPISDNTLVPPKIDASLSIDHLTKFYGYINKNINKSLQSLLILNYIIIFSKLLCHLDHYYSFIYPNVAIQR